MTAQATSLQNAAAAPGLVGGRRRAASRPRNAAAHHLAVAARVNALAVLPTTLFFFLWAGERTPARFVALAAVVFVLVNANFLVLKRFYQHVRRPLASRGRPAASWLLILLPLPILGLAAAVLGLGILSRLGLDVSSRSGSVLALSVPLSVVYGAAFFHLEDARRHRRETLLRLEAARSQQARLQRECTWAEIRRLQALIEPHFIFNTLNSIAALIHDQPDRAEETTLGLARLMRHILDARGRTLVSLEAEVGIVRSYLEIEQLRMGGRLRYEISLPESLHGYQVPAMILQPLVENAIKHGVRKRLDDGWVWLLARDVDGGCEIQVIDNGPWRSSGRATERATESGSGSGMRLVQARLERLCGEAAALRLERNEPAGLTAATLRIPRVALMRAQAPTGPVFEDAREPVTNDARVADARPPRGRINWGIP
jgi:hypothetical protein